MKKNELTKELAKKYKSVKYFLQYDNMTLFRVRYIAKKNNVDTIKVGVSLMYDMKQLTKIIDVYNKNKKLYKTPFSVDKIIKKDIIDYINNNDVENLTELAKKFGVSRAYTSKLFKQIKGIKWKDYQNKKN